MPFAVRFSIPSVARLFDTEGDVNFVEMLAAIVMANDAEAVAE